MVINPIVRFFFFLPCNKDSQLEGGWLSPTIGSRLTLAHISTNPITSNFLLIAGAEKRWGVVDNVSIKDGTWAAANLEHFNAGIYGTLPKTSVFAPENGPSDKETIVFQLTTIDFQGRTVSFRDGISWALLKARHVFNLGFCWPE